MKSTPRLLVLAAMFLIAWAPLIFASDDEATDAAFNALLSMPQAQPSNGSWNVEAPDGFTGTDETALIAWLADQRKLGADFNRHEHQGTLLQHALRSDMAQTALWLLRHGADPTLLVPDEDASIDPPVDALALAIQKQMWPVIDTLLHMPPYKEMSAQELGARYFSFAPEAFEELRKHGIGLPEGRMADCFLEYALDRGLIKLALALPSHAPLRIGKGYGEAPSHANWARACTIYGSPSTTLMLTGFSTFDDRDLAALDAKLNEPLLPYLIASLRTPQDVDRLFKLPLREVANQASLMRWVMPRVAPRDNGNGAWSDSIFLPAPVRQALVERLPPVSFAAALDDAETLRGWLHLFALRPGDRFAWALAKVPDAALAAHPLAAVNAVVFNQNPDIIWPALLARTALRLDGDDMPGLLAQVPMTSWPTLFARGYRSDRKKPVGYDAYPATEVETWMWSVNLAQLRAGWPLLKQHVPGIVDDGIERLLRRFSSSAPPTACRNEWDSLQQDHLDRLDILLQDGAHVPKPVQLSAACVKHTKQEIYAKFLATGAIAPADPKRAKRFTLDPASCRFAPDPIWLRALATRNLGGENGADPVSIDHVQMVDYPGDESCALIVSGGNVSSREFIDDESFSDGPQRLTPCVDPTLTSQVWRLHDGKLDIGNLPWGITEGALPLRDGADGKQYLLALPVGGSTCSGGYPAYLLEWAQQAGQTPRLVEVPSTAPAAQALAVECDESDPGVCFNLRTGSYTGEPTDALQPWRALKSPEEFIDATFSAQRAAYLEAVLALDKPRLATIEQQGMPPHWTVAAIDAVSKSTLGVAEKRRCTAWLFRDPARLATALSHVGLAEADDGIVIGLGAWLPREDWRPVFTALKGEDGVRLQLLANQAKTLGNPVLACRFMRAAGKPCADSK